MKRQSTERNSIPRCASLFLFLCSLLILATTESRAENTCGHQNSQSSLYSPLFGTHGVPVDQENEETTYWYFSYLSAVHDREPQNQNLCLVLYYEICNLFQNDKGRPLIASWSSPVGLGTAELGLPQSKCLTLERDSDWAPNLRIQIESVPIEYSKRRRRKPTSVYISGSEITSSPARIVYRSYEGDKINVSASYYVHYEQTRVVNRIDWSSPEFWIGLILSSELATFIIDGHQVLSTDDSTTIEFLPLYSAISDNDVAVMKGALGDRLQDNGMVMALGRDGDTTLADFTIHDDNRQLKPGKVIVMLITRNNAVVAWALLDGIEVR